MMEYRIGVDIGGTFTDLALYDQRLGAVVLHKLLTTPRDPSLAVIDGVQKLLVKANLSIDQVGEIVHGTTLVTNSVIERAGAPTGMLVTAGFRDVLDIGLELRYDLYDLRLRFPDPIVPRSLRVEIDERVKFDGTVERPVVLDDVREAVWELTTRHGVTAVAVCLLHSYVNQEHEKQISQFIHEEFPDLYVSASADVFPQMREYERWTTATVNAYTQPLVDRYLERLESGLAAQGFRGRFYIMTSSGGTVTTSTARRYPVRLLESGPAAGVLMSAVQGQLLSEPDVLSFDMGGTTAKGAVIRNHTPLKRYQLEVARIHEFKRGSGLTVKTPTIDLIEIGAGGGGIAEVDSIGLINVGPRSAGADPGPACYGLGGPSATLTDANLVLGYLSADSFLGGDMALDGEASKQVIQANIAKPLDLDLVRAAWGIHEIINEDVARAFRVHASERGFDYRGASMVAFGGCGPIHATSIAKKLRIPKVIFPLGAGVLSALGLLVSPLSFEVARSDLLMLDDLDVDWFDTRFTPLLREASGRLLEAGIPNSDIRTTCRVDMRYRGQLHEIEVTLPDPGDNGDAADLLSRIPGLFAETYERMFSLNLLEAPLEIMNWKVEAAGPDPLMRQGYRVGSGVSDAASAGVAGRQPASNRQAYFPDPGGYVACPVYDRYALRSGDVVDGPALFEERESTCVIGAGDTARVDDHLNLIVELRVAAVPADALALEVGV